MIFFIGLSFLYLFVFPLETSITDEKTMKICKKNPNFESMSFQHDCPKQASYPCGEPGVTPTLLKNTRIVGGGPCRPNSWPWQISIQYFKFISKKYKHFCGGSIISSCYVLTASHCVEDYVNNPSTLRVVAGIHHLNESLSIHRVALVYLHPYYRGIRTFWNHDIAILRVHPPFQFSNSISPICIPFSTPLNRTSGVATGWGTTSNNGNLSSTLNQVELPVIPWLECQKFYHIAVNRFKFCAGYLEKGGKDTCQGDSGGPLVTKYDNKFYLSGITSVGSNCAMAYKPGVYINVASYRFWISKFIYDKNECKKNEKNFCDHVCVNIPGSYKCECCDGYILTEGKYCHIDCGKPLEFPPPMEVNDVIIPAKPLWFPWQLSIRLTSDPLVHKCSGVLIDKNWILTSINCVLNNKSEIRNATDFIIYSQPNNKSPNNNEDYSYIDYPFNNLYSAPYPALDPTPDPALDPALDPASDPAPDHAPDHSPFSNFFKITKSSEKNKIKEQILKPSSIFYQKNFFRSKDTKYNENFSLVLIKTINNIYYYSHLKPVCLPMKKIDDDVKCFFAGWRDSYNLTLKQTLTTTKKNCEKENNEKIPLNFFCSSYNPNFFPICQEDLGAPLVCNIKNKMVAVGISVNKCTGAGSKHLFLDLSLYKSWIVDTIYNF